ncbi:MAG: hypothetical protein SPE03_10255 [Treponema sp.]|nr:hypothetical protein [Treponema sp.]
MKYAPIVLVVYTRKSNLENLIDSIIANPESKYSDLYIISDAPSKEEHKKLVNEVRDYLKTIEGFNKIELILPDHNSRKYNIDHVTPIIKFLLDKYGKFIFLEDDNIVSPHFLRFMNECLEKFKDSKNIGAICGYSLPIKMPINYQEDIYLGKRYSPWGMAFRKEWYEKIDVSQYDRYSIAIRKENKPKFKDLGLNFLDILRLDSLGKIQAHDARICFYHVMNDLYSVFPVKSLVKNVGHDGLGEHSGYTNRYDVELNMDTDYCLNIDTNVCLNQEILDNFRKFQNKGYYLKYAAKQVLIEIGLYSFIKSKIRNLTHR